MTESHHDPKLRSRDVTDGFRRAPNRAMLRAVGMTDDDWEKPQVGIASSWNEVTPCNMPLARLAKAAKEGVANAGDSAVGCEERKARGVAFDRGTAGDAQGFGGLGSRVGNGGGSGGVCTPDSCASASG